MTHNNCCIHCQVIGPGPDEHMRWMEEFNRKIVKLEEIFNALPEDQKVKFTPSKE